VALLALLKKMDLVVDAELDYMMGQCERTGESLLAALVKANLVEDEMVARLLSAHLNLNRVDLDKRQIDPRALTMLPGAIAYRLRVIPVGLRRADSGDVLYVAMSDPSDAQALGAVRQLTGMQVQPLVATELALTRCLARHYPPDELTDPTPFGLLPPDESLGMSPGASGEVPVVVGQLLSADDEATLRNVRDAYLSGGRTVSAAGGHDVPAPVEMSEWLTASTQEVLDVYAPLNEATPTGQPTDADMKWLSERAAGETTADEAATSEQAAAPARMDTRVDFVGPTTLVCPDIGLREWLKETLVNVVSTLRTHSDLATAVAENAPAANMVLIHPSNEPYLVSALKVLRQREIPPRVYVVSANRGFDVLGGVDVRIDPPENDDALAKVVLDALSPRRRS
jgi:hypothetical protein